MRAIFSKISVFFFLFAMVILHGCESSLNVEPDEDKKSNESLQVAAATTTVVNDGLQAVDISGITATNFVTAGTGTHSQNPEIISVDVPRRAKVQRVFLYWARRGNEEGSDPNTIEVNDEIISGNLIGGPVEFPGKIDKKAGITYRADITGILNLKPGINNFTVEDDNFPASTESLGASVLVFYSLAGEQSDLILFDGVDFLYAPFKTRSDFTDEQQMALGTAVPITFNFASASVDRAATLTLFIGDVEPDRADERPNSLIIKIGNLDPIVIGAADSPPSPFPFKAFQGAEWDNYVKSLIIPAGVKQVTVEPVSGPRLSDSGTPASLLWSLAGLSIHPPEGGEGCTPGYWRQEHHYDSWTTYSPNDLLEDPFNIPTDLELRKPEKEDPENLLLGDAIELRGGKVNALIRHAVAALLNAASPNVSYDLSVNEVITKFNNAVDGGDIKSTKNLFESFNEQGCPLN